MTSVNGPTCACGEPTAGARLCRSCTRTLEYALANIGAYYADLDTIRTRQTRYTDPAPMSRGGNREMPLPVDLRFTDGEGTGSDLTQLARDTIVGWTRIVLEELPPLSGPPPCRRACLHADCANVRRRRQPADNIPACCRYLLGHLPHLAAAEYAEEILDEALYLERRLRRFIDRPADRWYAGPCTAGLHGMEATWFCGAELYAQPGKPDVTCRDCGFRYDVADRRAWLLAAAEDRLENAATIARAVLVFGQADGSETQLAGRIRQWARRRRIMARANRVIDGKTQPLYRVGDVLDLLAEDARHAAEKVG